MTEIEPKKDNNTNVVSEEERLAIQKEIDAARKSLVGKEVQDAIEKAKQEEADRVRKELEAKNKLDEAEKRAKQLEESLKQKERESEEAISKIQKKVDELISSRAPLRSQDPFQKNEEPDKKLPAYMVNGKIDVDKMSEEDLRQFEEDAMKAFYKQSYNPETIKHTR